MDISVVIPVYNEEPNVSILYSEIKEVLNNLKKSHEIIFIDDGSKDKTFDKLRTIQIQDGSVRIIKFRKNFGQTAALDAGFKNSIGDLIITLDGDLQNDPRDIPKMIEKINLGYDVIIGWRHKRKDSFSKKFISKTARNLRSLILSDKLKDSGCSLRVYKRECVVDLNLYGEMHRFIHIILKSKGFKIAQMRINHRPRKYGQTKYKFSRTVKGFLDMILLRLWMKYSSRPMHIFGGVGLLSFFLGIISTLYLIYLKIVLSQSISSRPLLLFSVLLIIFGTLMFIFGFLADILIKIYYKGNSNYSIEKII